MDIVVRRGDTYWYYSQLFQLPLRLILDSNPTIPANQLRVGQIVKIPGFVTTNYQIKAGDTLWAIARSRNLPIDSLLLVNPNINPQQLRIGQTIKVPLRIIWRVVDGKRNYDYNLMMDHLTRLKSIYPFVRIPSIGNSVLGKAIPEVNIGMGGKKVHFNGSFHANEWITTPVIMTFLNDYLLALTNQTPIRGLNMYPFYEQVALSIVPMVNPDGVDLVLNGPPNVEPWRNRVVAINKGSRNFSGWKANIRGVDLNNQFPARWEIEAARKVKEPSPRDYPGERPLSEPEAIAMAQLTRRKDFNRVLAFHTQGKVIYWGFENLEPKESETLANEFARVSGYEPIRTVDSYAGYKDWFIQEWRRPGFTIELGRGVNPLPVAQFDEIYQEALGIFLASLYM
ncbi:M14 family metallopeptidase [Calidifontibacillus erzurumensis]|uniref:LysM peptidoglycan-binding domain-containing protein n=1 Tax=Calidifontibacillus erzurumensis TaxID=2741433 RepID=A0A8J8GAW2_9BACI|nr:M14 family metallopeptidase [Calidifontibacillus erzurumensis]NSL50434.1 LysM peptidoglycan-binding domain-containing protein [Calidifontibacillus erzurumensis]